MAISQDNPIKATEVMDALKDKADKNHIHDEYQRATVYKELYVSADYTLPNIPDKVRYIFYIEKSTSSTNSTIGIYSPRGHFFYEAYVVGEQYPIIGLIGKFKKMFDMTKAAVVAVESI